MNKTIKSTSEHDTIKAAQDLATQLSSPQVILLSGTLGAGKSVFARALIRAMTGQPNLEVPSPTFTLVQTYGDDENPIYHYDLYRIEDPEEIIELGWEDAATQGIAIVEWPERLGPYRPENALSINIEGTQQTRTIQIKTGSAP